MSAEEPSPQTEVPQANSNEEVESTEGDGPGKSIEKILKIVENLHKIFPSQPEAAEMRKAKSMNATTTHPVSIGLTSTSSVPVGFLKPEESSENSIPKLQRNLRLLDEDVRKLKDLNEEVGEEVNRHIRPLDKLLKKVEANSTNNKLTKGMKKDLEDVNKKIFNLMCQVPLLPNKRRKPKGLDYDAVDGDNNGKGIECLHGIHANKDDLQKREVFRYVLREFLELTPDRQICLLSFAVFPENQEVNRTMLMYWWIGEDILPDDVKPEVAVKDTLNVFLEKKLIQPVENKRKVEPNSYKMTPFVYSSVVLLSKELKLFDIYDNKNKPRMNQSEFEKVCLVEGSSSQPEAKTKKSDESYRIETVFNVSERFPDFAFKWFSEDLPSGKKKPLSRFKNTTYKKLMVFYLGRWERTAKRHIEVENPELMKNLKHMTKLRLLSLQGVSRIEILDDAACKLHELIILDLRACYNLEKLPAKIDSLKKLIYLDITDCYMIDRMPKRLSWLNNLEVLKGFVVSDATDEETFCTLAELEHLTKLRKLSITINKGDFTVLQLFLDIERFHSLEKLKVAWGGMNEHTKEPTTVGAVKNFVRTVTGLSKKEIAADAKRQRSPELPTNLKKLDLQCFPDAELPDWLKPQNLGGLEKLYIKGGTELTGFGKSLPETPTECNVKVLRLKFLPRLKVEWRELSQLYFPKLEYLDKYQCPQVSFCPCDGIGIWRIPEKQVKATQN